eukprot:2605901-Prymnesium_polylepis.1
MEAFKAKYARDRNLEIVLCAPPQLQENIKRRGSILRMQLMFRPSSKSRLLCVKQLSGLVRRRKSLENLGELTPRTRSRYLANEVGVTHMLLYASNMTFAAEEGLLGPEAPKAATQVECRPSQEALLGREGMTPVAPKAATQVEDTMRDRLAREVKRALACGIELLVVHENDEQSGGCSFGDVIARTPHELVAANLYKKIAV